MHKKNSTRLGKVGLATALVCLYLSGAVQPPAMAAARTVPAPTTLRAALPVIDIRGKVTDDKGEPLPGVTVVVKGTSNGTATGADGTFTLNLPEAAGTLVFSYIGYATREVPLTPGQTNIN